MVQVNLIHQKFICLHGKNKVNKILKRKIPSEEFSNLIIFHEKIQQLTIC